jgi:hypothetical protein
VTTQKDERLISDSLNVRIEPGWKSMKKILLIFIVVIAAYGFIENAPKFFSKVTVFSPDISTSDLSIRQAFNNHQSDIQVGGSGRVVKILPDDTKGSRHQKFIIELNSGQTLLIAHNIDIAPKIRTLIVGDHISFYGEYDWNAKGGVVHWTHHDPGGRHESGWLNHGGENYQ